MGTRTAVPWDELAARVDIVEVIGEHVHLRRSGREWVGLCPFHTEKTPSFSVNPDRQFFYCFGCHAGGDVYTFLMRQRGLTFLEAAEEVARRAGVDLGAFAYSERDRRAWEQRRRLLAACRTAADFFRRCLRLPEAAAARAYLQRRGFSPAIAERFEIGFAPEDGRLLMAALEQAGVAPETALEAGILVRGRSDGAEGGGDESSLRPRFRGRLVFPIRDVRGQVVGFGARKLSDSAWGPKYLNSAQTPLFNKGELLFGLWEARDAIQRAGFGLLVEGYTDVLALHQAGVEQAVAALGTAFTPQQAALLQRYTGEVVVAFDGDSAGERAALRSLGILSEAGLRVRVLVLPRGLDPDECVRKEGRDRFLARVKQAVPLTEFRLRIALRGRRLDTVDGRARAVEAVLPALAEVASAVELEGYVRRLSRALDVSEEALRADLDRFIARRGRGGTRGDGGLTRTARHTLAGKGHNMRGFASRGGEEGRAAGGPTALAVARVGTAGRARRRIGRVGTASPGVDAAARERLAALSRVEQGLLRHMLEGPRETLAVWERLRGVGFHDPLVQAAAEVLVEAARDGRDPASWPVTPDDVRVAALFERLRERPAPDGAEWVGWAEWLWRTRLRDELERLEGRLEAEAECAQDGWDVQNMERLIELLLEYHEVRLKARGAAGRRDGSAYGGHDHDG